MKVSWLIEKRVILISSDKSVSITDIVQANKDVILHLDDGVASTHIIGNFKDIASLPNTLASFQKILSYMKHPNLDTEILITDIGIIEFIVTTVNRTIGRRSFHLVKTYKDAVKLLKTIDPTLPDLPDSID